VAPNRNSHLQYITQEEKKMFIRLQNATKKYGEGEGLVYALDHTSLEIEKGEICVILAISGKLSPSSITIDAPIHEVLISSPSITLCTLSSLSILRMLLHSVISLNHFN
jgi:hypothetical protein